MTAKDVFELRKQGRIEEAYDAIRPLYANDKGPYTSLAMFWTAVDVLRARTCEGHTEEARKILLALERMLPNVPDKTGWVKDAFDNCQRQLEKAERREKNREEGPQHLQTGIWGEGLAAAFLREKGYVILERDWHSKHRDIDIIARNDDYVVFVEVKTRRNTDFGDPVQAVDERKRHHLRLAMNHYIKYRQIDNPVRFDIITIVGTPNCTNPVIRHLEGVQIMELENHRRGQYRR